MKNALLPRFNHLIFPVLLICGVLLPGTVFALPPTGNPSISFSSAPVKPDNATSTVVTWSSQNAGTCHAQGYNGWTGQKAASGTANVGNVSDRATFFLACDPGDGSVPLVESAMTRVGVLRTGVQLSADKTSLPAGGGSVILTWKTGNANTCTAFGHPNWTGVKPPAFTGVNAELSNLETINGITETTTLGITCPSAAGGDMLTDTVRIVVQRPAGAPSVSFYPTLERVGTGASTSLNWEVSGAQSCTASGGWSGSKSPQGGSEATGALSSPTVYKLSCQNASGTTAVSFPVAIERYPIMMEFAAEKTSITPGQKTFLVWSTGNINGCYGSGGSWSGMKPVANAEEIAPTATTTYTMVCSGDYGTAIGKATVTVAGTTGGTNPTATAIPNPTTSGTPNPANMSQCHRILTAADFPQTDNYAPPYDVVRGTGTLLMETMCGTAGENVTLVAGTGNPQDYVYDKGYVFRDNQWHQLQFFRMSPNVQPVEAQWYNTKISASFQMAGGKLAQESFALAFICHWDQNKWKCGCRDAACTSSKWNVQVFQRDGV